MSNSNDKKKYETDKKTKSLRENKINPKTTTSDVEEKEEARAGSVRGKTRRE